MPTYTDINQVPIVPGESNARATTPSNAIGTVIDGLELAAPAAPPANTWRLYGDDNGSGKTRLMVRFPTGAPQQVAIEP